MEKTRYRRRLVAGVGLAVTTLSFIGCEHAGGGPGGERARWAGTSTVALESVMSARGEKSSPSAPPASSSATPHLPVVPLRVPLSPRRFDLAKLHFDGLATGAPELIKWDVGGVFGQAERLAGEDERIGLLVRAHGDELLDGFERYHHDGWTRTTRVATKVCGRPAEIVRATRLAEDIACVIEIGGDNHPAYVPPTEVVAVGFEHAGLHIVFSIDVEAEQPEAYRALADSIIQSIRCD